MPIRTRRAAAAWSLGAAGMLWVEAAAAQETAPIHLAYDVPTGCPSRAEFLDMVGRDGGHVEVVGDETTAPSFAVHVEGHDTVVGRLVVREDDGTEATREIAVARCEDVVRSLAVLVSLAAQPPPPAQGKPPAPEPPDAVRGIGAEAPESDVAPEPTDRDAERAAHPAARTWLLDVSGEANMEKGVGPEESASFAAYVEWVDAAPGLFAPTLRLGVDLPANQGDGTTYRRIVGRVDACPTHLVLSRPWSDDAFTLAACARLDVGRLQAEAYGPGGTSAEVDRPWVAPAGLLRLRWSSPRFFVELEAGVAFPLVRENFSSGDDFEVPASGFTGGLGFGGFVL